ncbi:hypothetical protein V6N13_043576 [Hibiscus sabdariffa]|uniref:Uncharacterized protein n=1 Tax=Hibiscus sabdariffa TaxID=183260 RepID=A0ABR2RFZ9_9ROSI
MSSIGARCAEVYVMRKRQKEKMKRMEEERGDQTRPVAGGKSKVHPSGPPRADSAASASARVSETQGSGHAP